MNNWNVKLLPNGPMVRKNTSLKSAMNYVSWVKLNYPNQKFKVSNVL